MTKTILFLCHEITTRLPLEVIHLALQTEQEKLPLRLNPLQRRDNEHAWRAYARSNDRRQMPLHKYWSQPTSFLSSIFSL